MTLTFFRVVSLLFIIHKAVYDIRVAVIVPSVRLVDVANFLPHWRPKVVQMERR